MLISTKTVLAGTFMQTLLVSALRFYQLLLRPIIGNRCRFQPTCSNYAITAICSHGCGKGLLLTTRRLLRCNPCFEGGHDPVPEPNSSIVDK